ncbi:hypothetical protein EWH08_19095 [Sphingobium indicum]|jgi:hypothetical protein|uniref:DUF202 domain-containing protein n=3 Tax=Sphingomonadaceae TaxID=41297 RepID=A0A4Q4IUL4_9SPHN|nr:MULTISPECIES: hypothetical protein [Sphingomonadaceae]EJU12782.1 hypothetical protein LH128_12523 [Sphingomonas sp. LH128]NYI24901.1 hypothetical protein [Sphingobium indicum]RYL97064.1 hypothetical protein EWH08_19095 [Sphingobium indicum]BBF72623.1 hypothetical protein SBA_pBAR3_1900 [Sphingomonas bisphenolicum]
MPLWLDLLRTPMAAPETSDLRRMRRTWQALCILLALVVGGFGPLRQWVGRPAVAAVALALLVGTALYTALYLARKQRADTAYLDQLGERE